jgi:hypothetical protein
MAPGLHEPSGGQLRHYLEAKYSALAVNDREKLVEALVGLMEYGRSEGQSLHALLDHVAHVISRSLAFNEVVIGLYDRKEKDYFHEVVLGYRDDIANELKRLRYRNADMIGRKTSPSVRIGKLSEFNHVEVLSNHERNPLDRSSMGSTFRRSMDEFEKGDIMDVWMRDPRMGLVGWIRVSHPQDSKLPSKINVLWLELIASICACMVCQRWSLEDKGRRSSDGG